MNHLLSISIERNDTHKSSEGQVRLQVSVNLLGHVTHHTDRALFLLPQYLNNGTTDHLAFLGLNRYIYVLLKCGKKFQETCVHFLSLNLYLTGTMMVEYYCLFFMKII